MFFGAAPSGSGIDLLVEHKGDAMAWRERYDYSAIVDRKPLKLPKGARVAVWTIVNVEEWDITQPMARTVLPPPGVGGSRIPDVPNFSWFEYGLRVGFWRLKEVLDRHRIKATVSLNGSVCKSYPRIMEAMVKADWEISPSKRRVRTDRITPAGKKRLEREVASFERMLEGITRVIAPA